MNNHKKHFFYTSLRNLKNELALLAGPFETAEEAEDHQGVALKYVVEKLNPLAWVPGYHWGVTRFFESQGPGKLNKEIGVTLK